MYMYPERRIVQQVPRHDSFIRRLRGRAVAREQGRSWNVNIMLDTSQASRHVAEWGAFPQATKARNEWASFEFTKLVRTIQLSGEAMVYGGSPKSVMSNEVESLELGLANDLERNMFLSQRGEHAMVVDATAARTLEVDPYQYVEVGMKIDVLVAASGAEANGVQDAEILTVTPQETDGHGIITIDKDLNLYTGVDTTYGIYLTGERGLKGFSLNDICSASDPTSGNNYGGIDRDAESRWKAQEIAAGAAEISGRLVAAMRTRIKIKTGVWPSVAWAHNYNVDELIEEGKTNSRVDMQVRKFELWGPLDKCYVLSEQYFQLAHPKGWPMFGAWRRTGHNNGTILHPMEDTWGYQGAWIVPWQLVCNRCNAQGVITGIDWTATGA
jgi:hypothetical protein